MRNQNTKDKMLEKFTWTIRNFSTIDSNELYSDSFFLDNHTWCLIEFLCIYYIYCTLNWLSFICLIKFCNFNFRRILIFPKGNNVDYLSIYLDAGGDPSNLPHDWNKYAYFKLALINQVNERMNKIKGIFHTIFKLSFWLLFS